jgi:hypothetical protein
MRATPATRLATTTSAASTESGRTRADVQKSQGTWGPFGLAGFIIAMMFAYHVSMIVLDSTPWHIGADDCLVRHAVAGMDLASCRIVGHRHAARQVRGNRTRDLAGAVLCRAALGGSRDRSQGIPAMTDPLAHSRRCDPRAFSIAALPAGAGRRAGASRARPRTLSELGEPKRRWLLQRPRLRRARRRQRTHGCRTDRGSHRRRMVSRARSPLPQERGNAPNWASSHVCVQPNYAGVKTSPCDRLLCYQPRPGT